MIGIIFMALFLLEVSSDLPTRRMEPVGSFDGKYFFADYANVTHAEAVNLCELWGYEMVTLRSVAELNYLRNTLQPTRRFWTSGKDVGIFKWHNGNGDVIDQIQYPINDWHGTCIILNGQRLWADPCDASLPFSYSTLCEIIRAVDS